MGVKVVRWGRGLLIGWCGCAVGRGVRFRLWRCARRWRLMAKSVVGVKVLRWGRGALIRWCSCTGLDFGDLSFLVERGAIGRW